MIERLNTKKSEIEKELNYYRDQITILSAKMDLLNELIEEEELVKMEETEQNNINGVI